MPRSRLLVLVLVLVFGFGAILLWVNLSFPWQFVNSAGTQLRQIETEIAPQLPLARTNVTRVHQAWVQQASFTTNEPGMQGQLSLEINSENASRKLPPRLDADPFRVLDKERTLDFLHQHFWSQCMQRSPNDSTEENKDEKADKDQENPKICDLLYTPKMPWESAGHPTRDSSLFSMSESDFNLKRYSFIIVTVIAYDLSETLVQAKGGASKTRPDLRFILENHRAYADANGYGYLAFTESWFPAQSKRHLNWMKLPIIHYLLRHSAAEYIFYTDADSVFLNFNYRLESIVSMSENKPRASVWCSGDKNAKLNSGHFLVKNTAFARGYILACWLMYPFATGLRDNAAMIVVLGLLPGISEAWTGWPLQEPVLDSSLRIRSGQKQLHHPLSTSLEQVKASAKRILHPSFQPYVVLAPQAVMNSYEKTLTEGDLLIHFAGTTQWDTLLRYAKQASRDYPPHCAEIPCRTPPNSFLSSPAQPSSSSAISSAASALRSTSFFYVHVPKCGTSFERAIVLGVCPEVYLSLRQSGEDAMTITSQSVNSRAKKGVAMAKECKNRFERFIMDHEGVTDSGRAGRKVLLMTRDPLSRVVSGYLHGLHDCDGMRQQAGLGPIFRFKYDHAERRRFFALVNASLADPRSPFAVDAYARCVRGCTGKLLLGKKCGDEELTAAEEAAALRTFDESVAFAGVTERWTETLLVWRRLAARAPELEQEWKEAEGNMRPSLASSDLVERVAAALAASGFEDRVDAAIHARANAVLDGHLAGLTDIKH